MMHGPEESDLGVVAMKSANKLGTSAESMERRLGAKGDARAQVLPYEETPMSTVMDEEIKAMDGSVKVSAGAGDHPGQDDGC
jgi:hypothetical protein